MGLDSGMGPPTPPGPVFSAGAGSRWRWCGGLSVSVGGPPHLPEAPHSAPLELDCLKRLRRSSPLRAGTDGQQEDSPVPSCCPTLSLLFFNTYVSLLSLGQRSQG